MRSSAANGLPLVFLAACAASPAMTSASRGDRASLAIDLAGREARGDVSNDEAGALAQAVAAHDLGSAPPAEAVERIRDAWPCARELDDALAARMQVHDETGALAALARIDGGRLELEQAREHDGDSEAHWRAVGARALIGAEDRDARVRALRDPLPLVRRAATRAARDASDVQDLPALAEAARVDPEPLVRNDAVRAIAALPETRDGLTARTLQDLWSGGDPGLREDIAMAWAAPSVWNAGGRELLKLLVSSERGSAAIEAAAAVLRRHLAADELTVDAAAQMVRSIEQGASQTRLQALAEAPLDRREVLEAVRAASREEDPELAASALARLAEAKDADAIAKLEALAAPPASAGANVVANVARRARLALASAGDRRIQAWLEEDLGSRDEDERLAAATGLSALGRPGRAAPLLADASARVRLRAACTILMARRSGR